MTPLTEEEKREIVTSYRKLKEAIESEEDLQSSFNALQSVYRGNCRGYIDGFSQVHANQRSKWVGQLGIYLKDDIELVFWLEAGDVVIRRKPGMSVCAFAAVIDDGAMPTVWKSDTISEATRWAAAWVAESRGEIHQMAEPASEG